MTRQVEGSVGGRFPAVLSGPVRIQAVVDGREMNRWGGIFPVLPDRQRDPRHGGPRAYDRPTNRLAPHCRPYPSRER